jgi:hypothetical protein
MTRSAIVPAILALCTVGSAAALDHEFAFAPLVIGATPGTVVEDHVGVDAELKSKVTDDYRVIANDTALGLSATGRIYGLGLTMDTDWALGQSNDMTVPSTKNNPGELLRFSAKLDWAIEIRDPRDASIPLLQIIPHLTYITYPNQSDVYAPGYDNYLKDRQHWFGVDLWWALPVEGVELGIGAEQNLSTAWRAFRGGLGGRELMQYNAVDMSFWQLLNFGDSEYRDVVGGESNSGFTTAVIGGRATVPLFVEEVFAFCQVEGSYWLDSDIRKNNTNNGLDSGDVVLSVGINWMPE